jgi:hypothetical protein
MDIRFALEFPLGDIAVTPGAGEALEPKEMDLLQRHATGDWGEVTCADKRLNDSAVKNGLRILSAYTQPWVAANAFIALWCRGKPSPRT